MDRPEASGVIVAQGGMAGGWSLYLHQGRMRYCSNLSGLRRDIVEGSAMVMPGRHRSRLEVALTGRGPGAGATVRLSLDGAPIASGRLDATVPFVFSLDETLDVGQDTGSTVSPDYAPGANHLDGEVHHVTIQVSPPSEPDAEG